MTAKAPKPKPIARALISVSDKTGIVQFAQALHEREIEILSTGGTAKLLIKHGVPVIEVGDYTGFPEMMDGRVKTLHPKVHGGILGRREVDDAVMDENNIPPIDLVVVNLYPFEEATAKPGCDLATAIENIDIGGPTMLRAAAKNYTDVTVIVSSADYQRVLDEMDARERCTTYETRFDLAASAFEHTARYDGLIANYLGAIVDNGKPGGLPRTFNMQFRKRHPTRYGENWHQDAAFYAIERPPIGSIAAADKLSGKDLSYNNIADTDAALGCIQQFSDAPACVIVKHANPCGVAYGTDQEAAYLKAYSTDKESAFGGIIAFNEELTPDTARAIIKRQFVEVIIAPSVSPEAAEVIASKENVRLLECGQWGSLEQQLDFKRVNGGLLVQNADIALFDELKVVSRRQPSEEELRDLLFGWKVAKFVKSNAIVYTRDNMTIGVGAGQMSRVNSARIATFKAEQAELVVEGSVMASDAFFPFRDGIDAAHKAGITAVIEPGGSMRDDEVIAAADEHDMAMIFTGMRHFRH